MDELEVRRAVRDHYAGRAEDCGCTPKGAACCAPEAISAESVAAGIPKLGLGDTVAIADLRQGEVVLDLGSGPGSDVLAAAARVGPTGWAIGVDATPEMVFQARETARERGVANAEFRLGEIEHLPVESSSVDVIVSDCVINLAPDKAVVFQEALRVLKPGGRIIVSDVVADLELPETVRANARAWAACVAGAVQESDYHDLLRAAGFEAIETIHRGGQWQPMLHTAVISARRPEGPSSRRG